MSFYRLKSCWLLHSVNNRWSSVSKWWWFAIFIIKLFIINGLYCFDDCFFWI